MIYLVDFNLIMIFLDLNCYMYLFQEKKYILICKNFNILLCVFIESFFFKED